MGGAWLAEPLVYLARLALLVLFFFRSGPGPFHWRPRFWSGHCSCPSILEPLVYTARVAVLILILFLSFLAWSLSLEAEVRVRRTLVAMVTMVTRAATSRVAV